MAYKLNLISLYEETGYLRDRFCEYSVMDNVTGRLEDKEFRTQNGRALLAYINNKVNLITDEDHLQQQGYGLITALTTVASVTPIKEIEIQVEAAQKIAHILSHAVKVGNDMDSDENRGLKEFEDEDFDQINQKYNNWADVFSAINDRHFVYRIPPKTAEALDGDFQKTPAYQVCKIFRDETILTRGEKIAQSTRAIAVYKEKGAVPC